MEPYRERIEDFMRRYSRVLVVVVLAAVGVASASLLQTPVYQASAQVWVDWQQGEQQIESLANQAGSGEMIKTLPPKGERLQTSIQTMVHATESRSVAQDARRRLGLPIGAVELLDNLTVEQVENTNFIVLAYEDADPVRATKIVNTVGEVSSEFISDRSSDLTATVYEEAVVPESPVSPHPLRNGLLTLVIGLLLSAVLVLPRPRLLAARVASSLVGPAVHPMGEAELPIDPSEAERTKEQELLEALGRRGKLTAVEAALESGLPVEEANRILEELAFAGHLEVTVEHGRLLYSFWAKGSGD